MGLAPRFEPGERIGDLRIERELGSGAFGCVYLAHDELIGRDVALKVVPAGDDPRARERALREARAIGRLNHPHIAALFRVHEPDDLRAWLFEMEFIAGRTLEAALQEGTRLKTAQLEALVRAVTDALAHAHARHVVHGDIKPSNILVGNDGSIKLVDFGLARLIGDLSELLSESDHPGGTPNYMAPEIFMGQEASPRSDVWSLGVLAYRLLSGRQPFQGRGFHGLFQAVLNREPEPLDAPGPAWLRRYVERCLLKDPSRRPASAADLVVRPDEETGRGLEHDTATHNRVRFGQGPLLRAAEPAVQGLAKGHGAVLVVTGPPGSGKSTLLKSIRARCQRVGARWIECSVSELHGFQRPLLAALETAVGIPDAPQDVLDISASTAKLVRALYGDQAEASLKDRFELYWVLERVLRRLAQESPLCVAIEDAQFANAEDLGLIAHLARYLSRAGVLLAVTCRAEPGAGSAEAALHALLSMSESTHLPVPPLTGADLIALVEDRFQSTHVDRVILKRIVELSQGNPLVCEELADNMLATGAVLRRGAKVEPGNAWDESKLPRRIRELTSSRLANLDDDDRHLVDIAAVDGMDSDARAIAAVVQRPLLQVMRALQRISRNGGILRPTESGYRFVSQVMQETVAGELSREMRQTVHAALAEHLETRSEEVGPERIGRHWKEAGEPARARPHLRRAVATSLRRFEQARAVELAGEAGLVPGRMGDPEIVEHGETLMELARAHVNLGDSETCIELLRVLERAARAAGRHRLALRAHIAGLLAQYQHVGRDRVSIADLQDAIREVGECPEAAEGLFLLGQIAKYEQSYDDSIDAHERAIEMARRLEHGPMLAKCLNSLAGVSLRRGHLAEAEVLFHDAAQVAEDAGRREAASASRVNAVIAAYRRGELDGLVPILEKAIRQLSAQESPQSSAGARVVLANLLWSRGDAARAETIAREAVELADSHGQLGVRTGALRILAEVVGARGDLASAWSIYERAAELLERSGNVRVARTVHAVAMRLHLWAGDPDRASKEALPCLEQLTVDSGEASSIAVDLGEGVFYGLPEETSQRILEAVRRTVGGTPEFDAARLFVEIVCGSRARHLDTSLIPRFLHADLAYRRAQCLGAVAVIRAVADPSDEAVRWLRTQLDGLDHRWLRAAAERGGFGEAAGD